MSFLKRSGAARGSQRTVGASAAFAPSRAAAFASASSDDETTPAAPTQAKATDLRHQRAIRQALEDDENAFQYDEVEDDEQLQRAANQSASLASASLAPAPPAKSRYIEQLLVAHRKRQIETEIIQEKKQQKEYQLDPTAASQEQFVTPNYAAHLQERELIESQIFESTSRSKQGVESRSRFAQDHRLPQPRASNARSIAPIESPAPSNEEQHRKPAQPVNAAAAAPPAASVSRPDTVMLSSEASAPESVIQSAHFASEAREIRAAVIEAARERYFLRRPDHRAAYQQQQHDQQPA